MQEETEYINVYGARVHNLKDIDAEIPRNSLTVITGLSGSGKSSLAFDTIFAEGQRRYIETFSAYARNFLGNLERPDVDKIPPWVRQRRYTIIFVCCMPVPAKPIRIFPARKW